MPRHGNGQALQELYDAFLVYDFTLADSLSRGEEKNSCKAHCTANYSTIEYSLQCNTVLVRSSVLR